MMCSWDKVYILPPLCFWKEMLLFLCQRSDSHGRSFRKASGDLAASMTLHGHVLLWLWAISPPDIPLREQRSSVISREADWLRHHFADCGTLVPQDVLWKILFCDCIPLSIFYFLFEDSQYSLIHKGSEKSCRKEIYSTFLWWLEAQGLDCGIHYSCC